MTERRSGVMRSAAGQLGWWLVWLLPAAVVQYIPLLRRFPRRPSEFDPSAGPVVEAAGILETSEYEILRIAFAETFGREPRPEELGRFFSRYLLTGWTPWWATAVAREVIELYDTGKLPESRFAVERRPPATRRELLAGIFQSLLLLAVFGMIYVMFSGYQPLF